jgi:hypothetical protein
MRKKDFLFVIGYLIAAGAGLDAAHYRRLLRLTDKHPAAGGELLRVVVCHRWSSVIATPSRVETKAPSAA